MWVHLDKLPGVAAASLCLSLLATLPASVPRSLLESAGNPSCQCALVFARVC